MRLSIAILLATSLGLAAACRAPVKQDPYAPRPDDIPTALTCCVAVDAEGKATYSTMKEEQCPEENRNPVDTCDIGPGEVPR